MSQNEIFRIVKDKTKGFELNLLFPSAAIQAKELEVIKEKCKHVVLTFEVMIVNNQPSDITFQQALQVFYHKHL